MCALIPAAGRGARFGADGNKVFAPLLGRPLLGWTLQALAASDAVDSVLLIGAAGELERLHALGETYGGGKVKAIVPGGHTRQDSVRRGLAAVPDDARVILVHDAARCCVTPALLASAREAAQRHGAATLALPVSDTLVHRSGEPVDRTDLWAIQTPQAFARAALETAHARAARDGVQATDDAHLLRRQGQSVALVPGATENIKVTRPEDLALAEAILMRRHSAAPPAPRSGEIRVGQGYDVHPFATGRRLFLGGVEFPEAERGLLGHSDADVLLHAVCDALLGAAGMGDIGKLFPPSDPAYKDRASREFLQEVRLRLEAAGWQVGNIDVTVLAETPRIGPHAEAICTRIAHTLGIAPEQVSVKATTSEGLGFVGRREGIAAYATALLQRQADPS